MRPTLLGSLLDAARHNVSRGRPDIAVFESGTVFTAADEVRPARRVSPIPPPRRAAAR